MDPVSALGIAVDVAQITEQASNVFMGLFKNFRTVKQAPKLSSELREEAYLVYKVLEELKSTLETINTSSSMTPTLNNTVKEFARMMNEIENHIEVKESEIMKRFKWPFTQKENKEYLSKLERYKNFHCQTKTKSAADALAGLQNQDQDLEDGFLFE